MSDGKDRMSVLLDDPTSLALELAKVSRVVAEALGEHATDVSQRIRYGGGVVARDVPEPVARTIVRGLAAQRLGSFLVPRSAFRPAPRPKRAGALLFDGEGLRFGQPLRPDKVTAFSWAEVRAIHAHALSDEPGSEERDALPKRGGNLRDLSSDTRRLVNDIRELETREKVVVRPGLDLFIGPGPDLYRFGYGDSGVYAGLDLPPVAEATLLRGPWSQAADLGEAALGNRVEWDATIVAVLDERAGLLEVSERGASGLRVRLRLQDPGEVALRRLEPGAPISFRARIDGRDGELLLLGEGQLRRGTHSLENYLLLLRKLIRLAPPPVMVPPTTRRFAERATIGDIIFAKREELDAFAGWIVQALAHGVRFGEPEELADEGLVDSDEAELVATSDEEAEELDDSELEPDDSQVMPLPPQHARAPGTSAASSTSGRLEDDPMHHFAKTGRLDARHVKELVAGAAELETLEEDAGAADDPEVAEAMSFFDAKSGQWRLKDVLSGQEELDKLDEELGDRPTS